MPGHPVGQVTEGIGHELDIRVEDEVVGAGKLRQDGVVAGAKAAVLFAAAHLNALPGPGGQQTLPHGLFQPGAAAVRAGVVHQIEGQRVAAGELQHGLGRLEHLVIAVIDNNTCG